MPALVGQEDPGMDTGSPAVQPGVLSPPNSKDVSLMDATNTMSQGETVTKEDLAKDCLEMPAEVAGQTEKETVSPIELSPCQLDADVPTTTTQISTWIMQ